MVTEIITKEDLQEFKEDLLKEIKVLFEQQPKTPTWLRGKDVCELLSISPSTLQNLRINGTLPYSKVGSLFYYKKTDIQKILERRPR